ncbi:EamA family transporter [Salinibacterium sp. PAMC 21357]|uniref:EamA family transporter n=1 Tax=Salinibacterium sp. PAMC 21357 TaxID=1112215 RepID=UPI000287C917|nr:EamA family transporter [Salinibacterium sp. PAMC 21357]
MPLRSILAAVLVAVIWGLNFVVIDVGLEGMPPTLFLALRFMVVIVPAIFFVPRPKSRFRDVVLIGSFMSLGQFGLLYTALAIGMPPGLASLVLQAQVVLTVVFAALALRETPTRSQLVGVALGAAGLVVVGSGRGVETPVLAFFVTLAAAASWAIGNVIARRVGRIGSTFSPLAGLSLTVWSALVVPIPMLGLAFVINGADAVGFALTHLTVPQLLSTLYTAWLASLVGYGIWNTLLARHAASAVVPFTMLVPPVGMTTAWLALGEVPTTIEIVGGVMLLLGVAITTGVLGRRRRQRHTPSGEVAASADPVENPL